MALGNEKIVEPTFWLKDKGKGVGAVAPTATVKPVTFDSSPDGLICGTCGHSITTSQNRIAVAGSHIHRCMNRAGFLFELGCFDEAPGCNVTGEKDDDYSWFPGYTWRYALCAQCQSHLGWLFENDDVFFGLVNNRLRSVHGAGG